MDLWIRSQNRNILCKAQTLRVCISAFLKWCICNEYTELGVYESEERALEVLDEIQSKLMPKAILKTNSVWRNCNPYLTEIFPIDNDIEYQDIGICVYQMPKE